MKPAPRRVVITGMYAPYLGPFDGVEVWGCNRTYKHQPNLSRLYFMDALHRFKAEPGDFVAEVNALDIDVVATEAYPEIPRCRAFALDLVKRWLLGSMDAKPYFTSTIAYMMADALFNDVKEITIHRILSLPMSTEYLSQKPCLDFWCGMAMGRGVKLRISSDSNLCQPAPWETGLYGYEVADTYDAHNAVISGLRAASQLTTTFRPDHRNHQ
jgi:hypothetical protein